MKEVPFEAAKEFCGQYAKDQCIILSWDRESGETWVTTFGVSDEDSIQAANAGKILKDYLKLQRDHDVIPTRFENWQIERTDRYWYQSGRNYDTYVETTFWYEVHTRQRKETTRQETVHSGNEWELPDWAKGITERRRLLESDRIW